MKKFGFIMYYTEHLWESEHKDYLDNYDNKPWFGN